MIVDHTDAGAALRRLSFPMAVTMLGDQLLGIVDTIAIGTLGTVALAGITGATTVFIVALFTISGFLSGLGIVAAQRVGANDMPGFGKTVRAGALLPLAIAAAIALGSIGFATPVLHAMLGNVASLHAAALYLILRAFSLIPIVVSGTLIGGLGAAGNRALGVIVLTIINLIHIPLLLVLALGWLTHHPFGIVGAGVSSLLSETIAACCAIVYTVRHPEYAVFRERALDLRLSWTCTQLGFPEAVFLFAVVAPDSFIIALLSPSGPSAVAAFRALTIVSDLTFVVPSPLQSATQTIIGQRLGARDIDGALRFLHHARRLSFRVTTATGLVVAALAWPLGYLFTLDAAVASLAAAPLALHMVTLPIKGWAMVSMSPIRASGDTRFSMLVGIVCGVLVVPGAYLTIALLRIGLYGVPISWIFAWSARALLTAWKLRGGSWMRRPLLVHAQ